MSDIERGNRSHSDNHNFNSGAQNFYDEKRNQLELYKAALSNDWKKAETIYQESRMEYGVRITTRGETALHVATLAGHTEFVRNLVQKMNLEEIKTETKLAKSDGTQKGNTALHCAAISGNVKIAKAIMQYEDLHDLAMAKGIGNCLPIYMAAEKGNEEMVRYLYDFAYKNRLEALSCRDNGDVDEERRTLFLSLIKSSVYDVALQMAKALFPRQIAPEEMEEQALEELAQIPLNPPRFLHRCFHSIWRRQEVVMQENAVKLVELLWDSLTLDEERVSAFINSPDPNPIIEAAKRGNYNFLSILIATYPDILFASDHNNYTIIHHATLNRHVDIFKLIHIGSAKTVVTMYRDIEGNNMLHLAAKLASPNRLNIVPGAALQLQRELLWFEEVKKVMDPHEVNRKRYYSSDFPLKKMLLLAGEMENVMDKTKIEEDLFRKLYKVMKQSRTKEYHSSYHGLPKREFSQYVLINDHKCKEDTKKAMNQSDVVRLFKKLKKVMEEEHDEVEYYTQLWEMVDLFQEIYTELNEHALKQSTHPFIVGNRVRTMVARHEKLEHYINQCQLVDLFQEFNELMDRYNSNQSHGVSEKFFEEMNNVWNKFRQLKLSYPKNTQIERVVSLFQDSVQVWDEHGSNIGAFIKEMKNLENYYQLREYPPRTTPILKQLLQLYKEIGDLIERDNPSVDFNLTAIKLKIELSNFQTHRACKRVMNLFQEMNTLMEEHEVIQNDKSMEEYTPHDVFVKEHENLMEKGEKWMRDTANSCMIVAVLITTIAFAAAITLPGGNDDEGYPHFSSEILFRAFTIADSVSMIASATSLLNFLSILTARYTIDDFCWSLPNKLFVGLFTIFVSIVAMMVAFVLSIFIIFKSRSPPLFSILIAAASSLPIVLFLWQHSGLLVDVFRSTYASYFLFKPRNNPSSVFKRTSSSNVDQLKKTS